MSNCFARSVLASLIISAFLLTITAKSLSQQAADPNFDAKVSHPAYTSNHPKVLFDEAHFNFHTAGGRYKPFADLVTNDGYQVTSNKEQFQKNTLEGYAILVISNARGADEKGTPEQRANPAFTEGECDVVRDWVRAGGALFLIADHYPIGSATENLSKRFGVEMSKGFTEDPFNYERESGDVSQLIYTREKNLIGDHPITNGRDATERINRIIAFTGQSLKGPEGSTAFLKLADTAFDRIPPQIRTIVPAAGRAQAVALKFGQGRVVVVGEAAMLTAQGTKENPVGMNRTDIDNRQLALNIMHWLSKLLN